MRYFIQFSYVGTEFHGSQTQPNGITVQEVMEQTFSTILRMPIALTFAGRTDAGVHAEEMFAHLDYPEDSPIALNDSIVGRLNNLLPQAIAIRRIFAVPEDWHARFTAVARTYEYRIVMQKSPFLYGRVARVAHRLDMEAMNSAAQMLLGRHDFASFCRVHTDVKTTYCTVSEAHWQMTSYGAVFTITADRFLRNMVRAVVGTLMEVGRGRMTQEEFGAVIAAKNRCAAGQSAPAEGLYLTHVAYPEEDEQAEKEWGCDNGNK